MFLSVSATSTVRTLSERFKKVTIFAYIRWLGVHETLNIVHVSTLVSKPTRTCGALFGRIKKGTEHIGGGQHGWARSALVLTTPSSLGRRRLFRRCCTISRSCCTLRLRWCSRRLYQVPTRNVTASSQDQER